MDALLWLILAHAIGDWLLQTQYEAMGKASGKFLNWPLGKHCAVYTACFIPALLVLGCSLSWLALLFTSHYAIDRRTPILWWIRVVKRTDIAALPENVRTLLITAVDQIFHVLVLVPIALAA